MSVRRLAEDNVQPASFAFTAENAAWADSTILKYPTGREQSAVIPLLMRAQDQDGWVTKAAIEKVADMLGMAYIRVLEVATFYTQFQLQPVGTRAHVQVCGTTPCMLRGAEDLIGVCKSRIHAEPHHLNADGTLSWEEVECLGACVNAPMVAIFKDTYEDLTARQLEYIIERFEAGKPGDVQPGTQIDRKYSAAAGGLTALTGETWSVEAAVVHRAEVAAAVAKAAEEAAAKAAEEAAAAKATDDAAAAPAVDAAVQVPPSNAAKPVTDAEETNPVLKTPAEGKTAAAEPDAKPSKVALDDVNRPKAMEKPEKPDDLKLISGIGPKIEATLNSIGIFAYSQIVAWGPAERDWVDGFLNFKGRIERDEWARQAKALADGGEEEYIRVFGKKPR